MKYTNTVLDFDVAVDSIGVDLDLQSVSLNRGEYVENSITTGSLSIDLITGGGWAPGRWNTIFGPEASGKSTEVYAAIKSAIEHKIPVFLFDHEASLDPHYMSRILGQPLDAVMGLKKGNVYESPPLFRYYQPDTGEQTFRFMHRILKRMPEKLKEGDQWYVVYRLPKTGRKAYKKHIDDAVAKGTMAAYDLERFKETNRFYVPVENGLPQAIFFIDSFIAMLPEARDEDDEKSAMAKVARMFSENAPLVKTLMGRKAVTIVGTNQIRLKPMAMGNPEYEPGGETIRFFSDLRLRVGAIAPSTAGAQATEPCWDGKGDDCYVYFRAFTRKNKMFSPFREALLRICYESKGESGYGLDPMWDCWQYLKLTGQISGAGRYKITVPGPWENRRWTWGEIKDLIFNPSKADLIAKYDMTTQEYKDASKIVAGAGVEDNTKKKTQLVDKVKKDATKVIKAFHRKLDIRKVCQMQIESGAAFRLYFDTRSGADKTDTSSESASGSMDEDED